MKEDLPESRNPVGAPSKRTFEARDAILHALECGAPLRVAAEAAGIHRTSLHEWRRDDPEFGDAVRRAEGAGYLGGHDRLWDAVQNREPWAIRFFVERRFPEYRQRVVVAETEEPPPDETYL